MPSPRFRAPVATFTVGVCLPPTGQAERERTTSALEPSVPRPIFFAEPSLAVGEPIEYVGATEWVMARCGAWPSVDIVRRRRTTLALAAAVLIAATHAPSAAAAAPVLARQDTADGEFLAVSGEVPISTE